MSGFTVRLIAVLMSAFAILGTTVTIAQPASAAPCYGASCNGRDPAIGCGRDAITVRSMSVPSRTGGYEGQLDLRWSRACAANWGRYTQYDRSVNSYTIRRRVVFGRVTVWNPGRQSYGLVHIGINSETGWSKMTDGRGMACTGVEIMSSQPGGTVPMPKKSEWNWYPEGDVESYGWTWGPCY